MISRVLALYSSDRGSSRANVPATAICQLKGGQQKEIVQDLDQQEHSYHVEKQLSLEVATSHAHFTAAP